MLNNLDEIVRQLPSLSPWPWRQGERLEEGAVILASDGNEVGAAYDFDDLNFLIASPQLIESLVYEVRRLRKELKQKQRHQGFFSREHSRP